METATCEYCGQSSMRLSRGHRVCLAEGCAVSGMHWIECEHCRELKIALFAPDASRICTNLCSITLVKQCTLCKGMVPGTAPFCMRPGCSRAFRHTGDGDRFEPLSPPEVPAEPLPSPPPPPPAPARAPIDDLYDHLGRTQQFDDRYEILDGLFEGGMGQILRVRDHLLGRDVAMKRSTVEGDHPAARAQLLKEARVGSRLVHPHILAVHDFGVDPRLRPYFTMRLVEGASMRRSLDAVATACRTGLVDFPLERLLRVVAAACRAIHHAHGHGVVHLDLKPENILVSDFGEVFVIDWGLALLDGDHHLQHLEALYTRSANRSATDTAAGRTGLFTQVGVAAPEGGIVAGTPGFMAPEQWRGEGLGPATDVFGLGGILHYVLTGSAPCRPWTEGWKPGVSDITRDDRSPALHPALAKHPVVSQLLEICRKALMPAPEDRFGSAEGLEDALARLSGGSAARYS